jgi:signal transduction histidine kinase
MNWRVAFFAALMSLPALIVIGLMAGFVFTKVPKMIAQEPRRVTMEYRELAERLKKNPASADYSGARLKSWRRQSGKIDSLAWGRVENGARATVWCQTGEGRFLAKSVPVIEEVDYALVFYGGGLAVALVLSGLTVFCVVNFLGFIRKRDEFLAAAVHDLSTPLVAMRYAIGRSPDEERRITEKMIRLVDNIREFQRLGGRRRPEVSCFDITETFEEAYELFAEDYRDVRDGEDVDVTYAGGGDDDENHRPRFRVRADELMCSQILWNILGNDLKYAAPHGKVSVAFSADDRYVSVRFADAGPGMKPREMKKAFDRYYRAGSAAECGKGGFGIGLCTAREFAEAMGGKLTLEANSPRGCIFTLTLPRA